MTLYIQLPCLDPIRSLRKYFISSIFPSTFSKYAQINTDIQPEMTYTGKPFPLNSLEFWFNMQSISLALCSFSSKTINMLVSNVQLVRK